MAKKTSHIVVISSPAFSHQSSILEFCKRLIDLHDHIHVTCIFPIIDEPTPAILRLLESLPSTVHCIFLPPITTQDLLLFSQDDVFLHIQLAVSQSMPSFRNTLNSLNSTKPLVALIGDPFTTQVLEIAKEFNLLSYIYFPLSAMTTSLHLHLPTLDQQVSCEYKYHIDPIQFPGCIPIHGHDLPDDFHKRYTSLAHEMNLQHSKRLFLADGIIVNSFSKMEEDTMRALNHYKPTYVVGPIIQTGGSNRDSNGFMCVEWLEKQRPNSVLYVSFGSVGILSQQQVNELAFGLELSGQKFLWVLRKPSDSTNGNDNNDDDPLMFLPRGFLERTKEQGLVVPRWAPQTQILRHTSTGGFLTHCGWNSILESIMEGVPMITCPLFAEQRMNAVLLTEGLNVALKIKFNEKNGIVEREEIALVIRGLMMDGEERSGIQERIEVLKDAAVGALREDGSSIEALSQFGIRMEEN